MVPPVKVAVPLAAPVTAVTVKSSPSGSVSLATTLTVAEVAPGAMVKVSSTATGGWFAGTTGVTVTVTVPTEVAIPSETVYVNVSVPAKPSAGV
nr:hypothetical protein [Mycolicibacterium vanbaalenii]